MKPYLKHIIAGVDVTVDYNPKTKVSTLWVYDSAPHAGPSNWSAGIRTYRDKEKALNAMNSLNRSIKKMHDMGMTNRQIKGRFRALEKEKQLLIHGDADEFARFLIRKKAMA